MNRKEVEQIITEQVKPVFGFALKRCKSVQDAEDLSQEIVLKAFKALLVKEDVEDMGKFIWTVAHNALSNYYRDSAKSMLGVPIEEVAEQLEAPEEPDDSEEREAVFRLQGEIAYLSKLQRRIVIAYYFENRKQADIAQELGLSVGTVKWHLFEAKKELKRGMDMERTAGELKFNPIKFEGTGFSGSAGTKDINDMFRSCLTQNICYAVKNTAKTMNEIAEMLGVSPVYVEGEVEFLEEYGFLLKQKDKYIANFEIAEPTTEFLELEDEMYKAAAKLVAGEVYETLEASGMLNDSALLCNQTDGIITLGQEEEKDNRNFLLWALVPYVIAQSGEKLVEKKVTFEEAAVLRPDGGQNIFRTSVLPKTTKIPAGLADLNHWCGPLWNTDGKHILWQVCSPWSENTGMDFHHYAEDSLRVLELYRKECETGTLSKEEYVWLAERGYVKTNGDYDGMFKSVWQIVLVTEKELKDKLLALGNQVKEKHLAELNKLKAPYTEAVLASVPKHLKKVKEYELQTVFHADGLFVMYCLKELVESGKLKVPTEGQKKALSTLVVRR